MTQLFETLLPGEANFGLEPSWVQIYPYQTLAAPGDTVHLQVRMVNFLDRAVQARVVLALPEAWISSPAILEISVPPNERCEVPVAVQIPESYRFPYPRVAMAADVTFDGRKLGQIAEATVEDRSKRL
jgi:hypothetical protein